MLPKVCYTVTVFVISLTTVDRVTHNCVIYSDLFLR